MCWRENGNAMADVDPARIVMVPWLISTRPSESIISENIKPEQRLQFLWSFSNSD